MPKINHDTTDRRYFTMTPHIVLAMCRDAYDFTLWSIVKTVAGESGECRLSTDDIATMMGCSHGKTHTCRDYLLAVGLLTGELKIPPGESRARWHLSIPDLWPDNVEWRTGIGPDWSDYIAAVLRTREFNRHQVTIKQMPHQSPGDQYQSPGDEDQSPGDYRQSPGDYCTRDASLSEEVKEKEQEELSNRRPSEVWQIALTQLRLQMTKSTYETWVRDITVAGYAWAEGSAPTFTLQAANAYARDWLALRLRPMILRTLNSIIGRAADVTFVVKPTEPLTDANA